jgi:ribose 5-phosphate isomerase B
MISLGSDHGGYELKEEIKKYLDEIGIEYKDCGTDSKERTDYPIFAERVAKSIQSKECDSGILICKSGAGMTIVANKFKGIRAALGINEEVSRASKADDNINVLVLPAQYITLSVAIASIRAWIATEFKGGRYSERLQMIKEIEKDNMK